MEKHACNNKAVEREYKQIITGLVARDSGRVTK
jgi:hypothetical protein